MSSSLPPHPRPRTAPIQSSDYTRRRTSQTFRPSPLAGPVLSYASLSELDTSSRSHEASYSSSGEGSADRTLKFKRCASTGALAPLSEDGLQPLMPARTRSSRRSVVFAGPSVSLSRSPSASSKTGTPTLSSLISLSLSEEPRPHGSRSTDSYHLDPRNAPEPDAPHFLPGRSSSERSDLTISSVPSRRHSRLSWSPLSLDSPDLSVRTSSASSLRSATSVSSMATISDCASQQCGAGVKCDGRRVRIKELKMENDYKTATSEEQRRRQSLMASVEKHDWLTATPTPIFSRSGLRTQGVIMPISARKHQREQQLSRSGSNCSVAKRSGNEKQARDKAILDQDRLKGDEDEKTCAAGEGKEKGSGGKESKLKSSKSLSFGVTRRRSIFRVPSYASPESQEHASVTKEDSSEASENEDTVVKHAELTRSSESSSCLSPSESTSSSDPSLLTLPSTHSSSATSLPTSASSLGSVDTPSAPDEQSHAKLDSKSNSKSNPNKGSTQVNLDGKHPSYSSLSSPRHVTLLGVLRKLTIRKPRRTEKSN